MGILHGLPMRTQSPRSSQGKTPQQVKEKCRMRGHRSYGEGSPSRRKVFRNWSVHLLVTSKEFCTSATIYSLAASLAHVSRSVAVRLKTGLFGFESTGSVKK